MGANQERRSFPSEHGGNRGGLWPIESRFLSQLRPVSRRRQSLDPKKGPPQATTSTVGAAC